MEQPDNMEFVFFGIPLIFESYVNVDVQFKFNWLLFIHPSISAAAAREYVNRGFNKKEYKFHIKKWMAELELLIRGIGTFQKKEQFENQLAVKMAQWTRIFALPVPIEIGELAATFDISEDSLNIAIAQQYLSGQFTANEIIEYLDSYHFYLPEKSINALLDQLNLSIPPGTSKHADKLTNKVQ